MEKNLGFFNKMPELADAENWRIKLETNRGRNVFYTYREFLQCLCTNDCLKYAGGVELARIHHLLPDEVIQMETHQIMRTMNKIYGAYKPYMPSPNV